MSLPLVTELAGGVALYDASGELAEHARKRYPRRPESAIVRQYHHHSGALGPDGLDGARATARYVVDHRGWPGAAYHVWLPYRADRDDDGRIVVYMLQPWWVRCWHTGGEANGHGVGVCWQGDLSEREPSHDQIEAAEALVPWLQERFVAHGPDSISWHAEAERWGGRGKPTCPGPHVTAWLQSYRDDQR